MATVRLRAVLALLLLALVLSTTSCRGTTGTGSSAGGGNGHGVQLPWFPSSHQPDPTESTVAEFRRIRQDLAALNRQMDAHPVVFWLPPLEGPLRVTRPFRPAPTPYAAGHRGVDLAGTPGQEVRAAGAGTVTWAGVLAGRGVVVVSHGTLRTTYEPVTAWVTKGEPVRAGAALGVLQPGHPGCPASACLHWGLLRGADYLDPMSLLGGYVRLLPLGTK